MYLSGVYGYLLVPWKNYYAAQGLSEKKLSCKVDNPPSVTPSKNQATPQIHREETVGEVNIETYSRVKVTDRDG